MFVSAANPSYETNASEALKSRVRKVRSGDAWIAATALRLGCPLATHNGADFRGIPELQLIWLPDE